MKVLWNKGEFYTQVYEKPFCTQEPRGFSHREVQKDPVSIKLKLERNQLTKQLYKIANDILGIRFIIKAETAELKQIVHEFVTCCPYGQDACNIVDQTLGKTYDDGYKAIHVYIRPH
ncbi:hypothetical protein [Anoxybacillus flavithermus]|uniref:hypothetical protein n=1 Tax=Anoxybacillus flavithermus TaxID=33934 RepID=UPI001F513ADE|nr:hypothetical protein [Anoxybacillus flavithermus]